MEKENTRKKTGKKRLDLLLVERELVSSRTYAKAVIMSGVVFVDDRKVDKPGTLVDENAQIVVKQDKRKYVSRGGLKLEAAIEHFRIKVKDKVAMDIGASTGGFTDCLLQYGAKKVHSLDVGYGQLDWNLRNDPRVVVKERINCRYITPEDIGEQVDLIVIDVSFISLTKILKPALEMLKKHSELAALIKPQYEVGKGQVGKGGIVTEEAKHTEVKEKISRVISGLGCEVVGIIQSPVAGADGNREFLIYARKSG